MFGWLVLLILLSLVFGCECGLLVAMLNVVAWVTLCSVDCFMLDLGY